jgi:hypothetical protein
VLSARGFREGESGLRVSIGDEGVVLPSVLSIAQTGLCLIGGAVHVVEHGGVVRRLIRRRSSIVSAARCGRC